MEGTVAIYGNEALYKVYAVVVVPQLRKDSSREKNSQMGRGKQENGNRTFGSLLNNEQEKLRERDVVVTSAGYTKDAMPFSMLYRTREY